MKTKTKQIEATTSTATQAPWQRLRTALLAQGLQEYCDSSFAIPERLWPRVSIGFPRPGYPGDTMRIELHIEDMNIFVNMHAGLEDVHFYFEEDMNVFKDEPAEE